MQYDNVFIKLKAKVKDTLLGDVHTCCCESPSHARLYVTPGLWPTRLLCPWDSPGENTGVGCHCLLQGTFPTQGWKQADSLLSHLGRTHTCVNTLKGGEKKRPQQLLAVTNQRRVVTCGVGVGRGGTRTAPRVLWRSGPLLSQAGSWAHKCLPLDFKLPLHIQYIILCIKMLNSYQKYFIGKEACFSHM